MDFKGKTVVVTGANKGIGRAIALYFYDKNANVVFAVRDPKSLDLPDEIATSERSLIVEVDVTNEGHIQNMVDASTKKFNSIDILINNAGVDQPCPLLEITEKHLDYVWDVNVKGLILCSKYVARQMVQQKYGKIINLSSIAGKEGSLCHTAYVSSKHAVIGVTKCMARELITHGITVNAVCPGLINTDMLQNFFKEYAQLTGKTPEEELNHMIAQTPRGEMGTPEDVAELVGFLCSDKAANIVGHAINTDGGILQH
jgi:NAD(P)-dependent dehydrogenase (short-subunit alcohol dehydrogenase family)